MASNLYLAESQLSQSGEQEMNLPSVPQAQIVVSSSSEATDSESDHDGSRSRATPAVGGGNSEPMLFQRIWSEEDEIVILKGLIKYSREKGSDPMADLGDFLNYIKGDLELNCTRKQLKHKIMSLKRKYKKHRCKEVEEGVTRTFSSRHKQRAYRLAGAAWGDSVLTTKMGRPRGSVRKRSTPDQEVRKRPTPEDAGTSEGAARVGRDEGESSSFRVEDGVAKAWEEICLGEGDGEWKKKLRTEDVRQHCKELQEKLLHSRFILYVLSCQQDSSST